MKEIAGFSNGDLLFQTVFFTRQNMSPPKSVIDLRNSLQEKMEKLPSDQIQKMMRGDHVRQTMERTSMRRSNLCNGLSINQSQALQSTTNLSHQDMSDVILLYFDSQSKQIFLKRLELSNERISESASVWIKVLFDVWCTSSHFLEKSPMLVKKFESVSEPMTIYYAGKAIMESREFKCPLCPEVFPLITQEGRNRYESHRNVHEIQNFSCQCNVLLNTTVDRTNHIKLFHSNGKYKQCSDCEFIGTNEEVTIHRNQIHQTYICDVCGHVSENVKKHNNHILKHKVFKCKECGEEFVGSSKFSHHRADVHGKEFSCEECGKIIKGRWKWLQHVKSTHGGNRFMCDICGQGFKHKLTMKRHKISVHIKNRPFVCRYGCGADYNDECNLRTHEKRRHGGIYKKGDSYKDVYKNL
ncbi:hypothetical protein TCAL_05173 [Tigriopus californicus]|uniref:C2H2-type domain-containing protein n=2 Tax=Tigriopus californicus TaxID=6832 RepID=A0A553NPB8_TIGCA|nr:hypothetical protein TCAL_05173 [Tigriopus californicus]|eukprot:TCALIF_05173-PA protein Name:"Similar to ZNF718 Zinc finger protein 718 (Homo sapiens)" AED:0.02 eAED:0.02 QI:0/1/0.5/1/1/0.5/2/40/411